MTAAEKFWDGIARSYAAKPVRDPAAYDQSMARTRAHLPPEADALEWGCGTGSTALRLAGDVRSILATDVSAKMIEIARGKAEAAGARNLTFRRAEVLDDAPGPFDAVLAYNLLHLVDDVAAVARRAAELLRPGGVFISKTACLGGGAGPLLAIPIAVMRLFGKAPRVRFLTAGALEAAMRDAGLVIVESADHPDGGSNRFIVARKPGGPGGVERPAPQAN